LGLVSLAKLNKNGVDFAHNHSTMPSSGSGGFEFVAISLAKWGKRILQKYVTLQAKGQANKSIQRNWQARFLINRSALAKAHYGGVTLPPLPIR